MKTTILTFALALAAMPLTFAATQTPAPADSKPAATATPKTHKKHHQKANKNVKTPAASTTLATRALSTCVPSATNNAANATAIDARPRA